MDWERSSYVLDKGPLHCLGYPLPEYGCAKYDTTVIGAGQFSPAEPSGLKSIRFPGDSRNRNEVGEDTYGYASPSVVLNSKGRMIPATGTSFVMNTPTVHAVCPGEKVFDSTTTELAALMAVGDATHASTATNANPLKKTEWLRFLPHFKLSLSGP